MTVIGIDPAADSFVACAYPAAGAARAFAGTLDGFAELDAWLSTFDSDELLVAVENTGVYGEALCYYLHEHRRALVLVAPGAISRTFPGTAKTDALGQRQDRRVRPPLRRPLGALEASRRCSRTGRCALAGA